MGKTAAYIRLSKEDEKKGESESITNQRELIKNYVNKNELGECEFFVDDGNELGECEFFVDDGYSGGNFERPQFKKMIEEIRKRKNKYSYH